MSIVRASVPTGAQNLPQTLESWSRHLVQSLQSLFYLSWVWKMGAGPIIGASLLLVSPLFLSHSFISMFWGFEWGSGELREQGKKNIFVTTGREHQDHSGPDTCLRVTTCNNNHWPPGRAVDTTGHAVLRYIIFKNCPFQWRIARVGPGTKEMDKEEP